MVLFWIILGIMIGYAILMLISFLDFCIDRDKPTNSAMSKSKYYYYQCEIKSKRYNRSVKIAKKMERKALRKVVQSIKCSDVACEIIYYPKDISSETKEMIDRSIEKHLNEKLPFLDISYEFSKIAEMRIDFRGATCFVHQASITWEVRNEWKVRNE